MTLLCKLGIVCLVGSNFKSTCSLTLLHSERPKLYTILAFLSTIGLIHLFQGVQITFDNSDDHAQAPVQAAIKPGSTLHVLTFFQEFSIFIATRNLIILKCHRQFLSSVNMQKFSENLKT